MRHYFFDTRDGGEVIPDEEGMFLPDLESAQEEAARALADLARDMLRGQHIRPMAVRNSGANGPVVEAVFQWTVQRQQYRPP